jgi:hypothetical protein
MITHKHFEMILESVGAEKIGKKRWGLNALGIFIIFEWYKNLCNAYIDHIEIYGYDDIKIDTSWPNSYSKNILLKKNDSVVAVIPIEK